MVPILQQSCQKAMFIEQYARSNILADRQPVIQASSKLNLNRQARPTFPQIKAKPYKN